MNRIAVLIYSLLLFVLSGCLEHEVTTTVNADGSCDRVVIVSAKTGEIPSTRFPLQVDASWDTGWVSMGDSAGKTGFRMSKHFASGDELAAAYPGTSDPEKIRVIIAATKSFRWFYTYHHYQESYRLATADTLVAPEKVMSEEEIRQFTEGVKSDSLKNKFEEWRMRNLFEGMMRPVIDGALRRADTALASALRSRVKEQIFQALIAADRQEDTASVKGKKKNEFTEDSLLAAIVRATGKPAVQAMHEDVTEGFKVLETQLKNGPSLGDSYSNAVIMPGVLLETNAPNVQGSRCSWKLEGDQMVMRAFTMHAESRTINVWAFVVAGIVAAGLMLLLFRPMFVHQRQ